MKKQLLILSLGVALCPFYAQAQYNNNYPNYPQQGAPYPNYPQQGTGAGNVNITSGPNVSNVSGNTATLSWTTDRTAANRVEYRADGENSWHSAYEPGGSTNHTVTLSNLIPGRNYQFRVMTRDNQVRTAGNFSTAANGGYYNNNGAYNTGTYNNGGYYNNGTIGNRGDRDRDNNANRGDRDNDANRADHDRSQASADHDRDYAKNKNHADKDKSDKDKKKNKKDNEGKDNDRDNDNNSNPR